MQKKLSMLSFFAITISMVMDVYEYPIFATSGLSLIFYLIVGGIVWFIPVALCSAELATVETWDRVGIFTWVKNTMGEKYGFAAIFFQWLQVTVGFITMLYFIVSAITYALDLQILNTNPFLKFISVTVIFWLLTSSQLKGTKKTEWFGKVGTIIGIIIPAIVLFILVFIFLLNGNQIQVNMSFHDIFPDFTKLATLLVFISFILSYMGVEASASYVGELDQPNRNYPLAILLVVIAAMLLNTVGGLAVAFVIPSADISLSGGILQAFHILFTSLNTNIAWFAKVMGLMIAIGVIGEITGWILGPISGMYAAAQQGLLPVILRKVNKYHVPIYLVLIQGLFVTFWAFILTLSGGGNNISFLVAISLTVIIYLISYFFLFISYFLKLRNKNMISTYQIPGGNKVKWIISITGFIASLVCFILSFIPPAELQATMQLPYIVILICILICIVSIPFIIYHFHDKSKHHTIHPLLLHELENIKTFRHPRARAHHAIIPDEQDIIK